MAENMMNKNHKATNQNYRDGWDRTFKVETVIIIDDNDQPKSEKGKPLYR